MLHYREKIMNYGDIIEYTENTFSNKYVLAQIWCKNNNASLIERVDLRNLPLRYFQITKNPEPEPYIPTEDEKKAIVRSVRNQYLLETDFTQLPDAPFTAEEKLVYTQYRQYLRDYTNTENWWESNPLTFDEWKNDNIVENNV